MKKNILRIALFLILVLAVFAAFKTNIIHYLNFDYIKAEQVHFNSFYEQHTILTIATFMTIYITAVALSLPSAAVLTFLSGVLFGFVKGTIIASFASTIGATLAFLASRFIIGNWVQKKYGQKLQKINDGIEKEGAFYLFALRLVPIFPFFVLNILIGLTKIKTATYFFASQLGLLPVTMTYVYAGTQFAKINSLSEILSPGLLIAFTILGILPLISKKLSIISE